MSHNLIKVIASGSSGIHIFRCRNGSLNYISKCGIYGRGKIGTREVVGFGINGSYSYADRMDFPYPAIRFKEVKGDLIPIKEKEKGDWKKLTIDEKKALYRASFCRTFAEMGAPSGEWKTVLGSSLGFVALGFWVMWLMKKYVYGPLPASCSPENRERQVEYYIKMRVDPIDGISSKWDYEKDQWKE